MPNLDCRRYKLTASVFRVVEGYEARDARFCCCGNESETTVRVPARLKPIVQIVQTLRLILPQFGDICQEKNAFQRHLVFAFQNFHCAIDAFVVATCNPPMSKGLSQRPCLSCYPFGLRRARTTDRLSPRHCLSRYR